VIIILEGPDGSGKTTLARQLCKEHHLLYRHEGPPPAGIDPLYHYGRILDAARDTGGVFDRFALGERVYGPILRGRDGLGPSGWRVFRRLLWASGAHTILCLPDYATCYANWSDGSRRELIPEEDRFRATYDAWHEVLSMQNSSVDLVYDYTRDRFPCLTDKPSWPRPIIGSPAARYLLVGDRGSDPTCPTDLAFFGTSDSAAYLTLCLERAFFHEWDLAWVNAFKAVSGTPNQLPDHEQFARVIALGAKAAGECERQGLDYLAVPHPQYWRRFHHHDVQDYADQLAATR
jgi:hypothetical protein